MESIESGLALGDVQALNESMELLHGAEVVKVDGIETFVILPKDKRVESLKPIMDQYLEAPERIKGEARIGDIESFLAHAARFGSKEGSAIFAHPDRRAPHLLAVYDYSEKDGPDFHGHRAKYVPPMADEWLAWTGRDGQAMKQGDFAAFIEDRIGDVIVPDSAGADAAVQDFANLVGGVLATPQRLIEVSRGLSIAAEQRVKQAVNLGTGEVSVSFEETHGTANAGLKVPNLFVIAIPVFYAGPSYRIPVRLRYRLKDGVISWSLHLYRADRVFDDAFGDVVAKARTSGLPVFVGAPES
jgi:uncharacterized protein YfdQ (DUF2303 family)